MKVKQWLYLKKMAKIACKLLQKASKCRPRLANGPAKDAQGLGGGKGSLVARIGEVLVMIGKKGIMKRHYYCAPVTKGKPLWQKINISKSWTDS